jgi:MazG family protein
LIEEAHELDEALGEASDAMMCEELGDVLLQVLFHSLVAEQRGAFDIGDVAWGLIEKMRRRHPHLYGDGVHVGWERLKSGKQFSIEAGLPSGLPSLHRAHRLQDRAAGVGFDWDDLQGPADKVAEELSEVREHLSTSRVAGDGRAPTSDDPGFKALEAELGDLLFAVVNLCRKAGVHAGLALDGANIKFARRFTAMERLAGSRAIDVKTAGLQVLDGLWDEVKAGEG